MIGILTPKQGTISRVFRQKLFLRPSVWGDIVNKYATTNAKGQLTYDWGKISDEFWETVNRPWLDAAIARGDNFRFVSNPHSEMNIYVTVGGRLQLDKNGSKIKSIFGREIDYLKSKGYTIQYDGTAIKQ